MPSDHMSPALFYADYFGIIFDDKSPQWITLKVYQPQINYLRSVPLHPSQKEIDALLGYSLFRIYVRSSHGLVQHLSWNRST